MAKRRGFGALRKLPSGRWQASYIGPDTDRHYSPTTYQTRQDADYWLMDERRELERYGVDAWMASHVNKQPKREVKTLRDYSADVIAHKLRTKVIRETTADKYRQALKMRVLDFKDEPALGDTKVPDLTSKQIAAWWGKLDHDHKRACDLAYQVLRTVLNQAIADELIADNPCVIKGAGGAAKRRAIDPLTPEQVASIAAAIKPESWSIAVYLGAWCALRSGEVRELRRRDVRLSAERPVLQVRRAVVRIKTTLSVGDVKTDAGRRDVLIPAPIVPLLKEHLETRTQPGPDGLLVWDGCGQVDDRDFRKHWIKAVKDAGLSDIHFHDLRHTGLTYSAMAGATIRELQQIAGHTTPAMALLYQGIATSHLGDVVDRLGAIIQPVTQAGNPTH